MIPVEGRPRRRDPAAAGVDRVGDVGTQPGPTGRSGCPMVKW